MDIFLVRHGEAAASWGESSDPGLSELGKRQAAETAQYLLPKVAEDVSLLSSPLLRAQQTAEPLAEALSSTVSINPAFAEIPAPVPLAQRQDWLKAFMTQQWQAQPESLVAWRSRAMQELQALVQPTVIFTHFLVLNAVVGQLLGRDETLCFGPGNASVTHLRSVDGVLELVELGEQLDSFIN